MDSPPRLTPRWSSPATPATPTKRVRNKPRTPLNKSSKMHNCRRCLFGRPAKEEVNQWLDSEMQKLIREQQSRWNFDFATMTPISGGDWQWEKVNAKQSNPLSSPPGSCSVSATPLATLQPMVARRDSESPRRLALDLADSAEVEERKNSPCNYEEDDDDVFDEPEIGQLTKRIRLINDPDDENVNPVFGVALLPTSPITRFGSPLFGRGSLTRSFSESSDVETTAASAPTSTTVVASTSSQSTTSSKPILSASHSTTSSKPLFSSHSLSTVSTNLFVLPTTPSKSSDLTSPPKRAPKRDLSSSSSSSSSSSVAKTASTSQKRLKEFFPVKRRSLDVVVASSTASSVTNSAGKYKKRINFE